FWLIQQHHRSSLLSCPTRRSSDLLEGDINMDEPEISSLVRRDRRIHAIFYSPMFFLNKEKSQLVDDFLYNTLTLRDRKRIYKNIDRKSTRLNSSHVSISYNVFCLK